MTGSDNNLSRNGILLAIGIALVAGAIGSALAPQSAVHIIGFCSMICVSLFALLRQDAKMEVVAHAAEEVRTTLEESTAKSAKRMETIAAVVTETKETGDKTHKLVNSNYRVQLQLAAELSRWKATHEKTPENEAAALKAEELLREHDEKQAIVDATEKKPATAAGTELDPMMVKLVPSDESQPVHLKRPK